MLDTRGNTAVYLQYTHARLSSILRKAETELGVDLTALKASDTPISLQHDAERALAFELMQVNALASQRLHVTLCRVKLGLV